MISRYVESYSEWVKDNQSCLTLCYPTDYTVHGILQARILEWVAFPFFRESSQPRDRTQISCIAAQFFTSWATREAQEYWSGQPIPSPADLPDLEGIIYAESKKKLYKWTYLQSRYRLTDLMVDGGMEGSGEGIVGKFGIYMYTLLYLNR